MGSGSIVAASLGGLGLFLLGSWMAAAGLGHALSGVLRERGAVWTSRGRGALLTGLTATIALGWSGSFPLAAPALGRRWRLAPAGRGLLLAGSLASLALLPPLVLLDGSGWFLRALACTLVGAGALLRIVRPARALLGEGLAGHGLALLGIGLIGEGLGELALGLTLPGARGEPPIALAYVLVGLGLGALLRSPAAALVVVLQLAASGLAELHAAAALVAGATASFGVGAWRLGRSGDAEDGASAAAQGLLAVGALLFTGLHVFLGLRMPVLLESLPGGPVAALGQLVALGVALAVGASAALSSPLQNVVRHRLNAARKGVAAPYSPSPLEQSVPSLLVEDLTASLDQVLGETRKLAQARLQGGQLSQARMRAARELCASIRERMAATGRGLDRVRWSGPEVAQALGAVRATETCTRLIAQLEQLPEGQAGDGLQQEAALASVRLWNLVEAATRTHQVPLMEDFLDQRDLLDHELMELCVRCRRTLEKTALVPEAWPAPAETAGELAGQLRALLHTTCELADARSIEFAFGLDAAAGADAAGGGPEASNGLEDLAAALPEGAPTPGRRTRIRG